MEQQDGEKPADFSTVGYMALLVWAVIAVNVGGCMYNEYKHHETKAELKKLNIPDPSAVPRRMPTLPEVTVTGKKE